MHETQKSTMDPCPQTALIREEILTTLSLSPHFSGSFLVLALSSKNISKSRRHRASNAAPSLGATDPALRFASPAAKARDAAGYLHRNSFGASIVSHPCPCPCALARHWDSVAPLLHPLRPRRLQTENGRTLSIAEPNLGHCCLAKHSAFCAWEPGEWSG